MMSIRRRKGLILSSVAVVAIVGLGVADIIQSARAESFAIELCRKSGGLTVNSPIGTRKTSIVFGSEWRPEDIETRLIRSEGKYDAIIFYYPDQYAPNKLYPQVRSLAWKVFDVSTKNLIASYVEVGYNGGLVSYYLGRSFSALNPGLRTSNVCDAGREYREGNVAVFNPHLIRSPLRAIRLKPLREN